MTSWGSEHADLRREEGLEGGDQLEDLFGASRKDMIQFCGKREERTDASGRVGTDFLGPGEQLSGEWGEREQR